ncbi:hypothetical protein NQ317_015729 [Molorchus minor]|uniref:Uncharacterized protein n=1 Tax=Molorchus minor TaxID=1323400 RepID=A0ABQ9IU21_9CUCU|nr:hypothetical protein NQ317_015729 [Molorchus minor]
MIKLRLFKKTVGHCKDKKLDKTSFDLNVEEAEPFEKLELRPQHTMSEPDDRQINIRTIISGGEIVYSKAKNHKFAQISA